MEENTQNENAEHQLSVDIKNLEQTEAKQDTNAAPATHINIDLSPILITVVIVVAIIYVSRKIFTKLAIFKNFVYKCKDFCQELNQSNEKISKNFQQRLCKGVENILSGQYPPKTILQITDSIRNGSGFSDIPNLQIIYYTITQKDSATVNIKLSIVIKKELLFGDWNLNFDNLPDELNEAYIKSESKSVTMLIYKRGQNR
jgi:hypothetical protein